jgi:hypothetical protein
MLEINCARKGVNECEGESMREVSDRPVVEDGCRGGREQYVFGLEVGVNDAAFRVQKLKALADLPSDALEQRNRHPLVVVPRPNAQDSY